MKRVLRIPVELKSMAVLATMVAASPSAFAQTFQGIGHLSGGSIALGISADGSTVVGTAVSNGLYQAFRWRAGTLTPLPGITESVAYKCSHNGDRVAGYTNTSLGGGDATPTLWDAAGVAQVIARPDCGTNSTFQGFSDDGTTAVGYSNRTCVPDTTNYSALRWSASSGLVSLPDLPGGDYSCVARAASANGLVIAGIGATDDGDVACRWVGPDYVPQSLGYLPGGIGAGDAWGVSRDGVAIVGWSSSSAGKEAYVWTEARGMVSLGDLPGGLVDASALSVSDDHRVIVGYGSTSEGTRAFIWSECDAMRDLKSVLEGAGLDLTGWTLTAAWSVSADGSAIVGAGINPNGQEEGWIATLPCITILQQPTDKLVCCDRSVAFYVGAQACEADTSYQWQTLANSVWVNLVDGDSQGTPCGVVVGATTRRLTVAPGTGEDLICLIDPLHIDGRQFRCVITRPCGTVISRSATLRICKADFNCDGAVNSQDFFDYITAFFTGCPWA